MIRFFILLFGLMLVGFVLVVVVPLGLFWHYRSKWVTKDTFSSEQFQQLQALQTRADKLEQRVKILETILDNQVSNWKEML